MRIIHSGSVTLPTLDSLMQVANATLEAHQRAISGLVERYGYRRDRHVFGSVSVQRHPMSNTHKLPSKSHSRWRFPSPGLTKLRQLPVQFFRTSVVFLSQVFFNMKAPSTVGKKSDGNTANVDSRKKTAGDASLRSWWSCCVHEKEIRQFHGEPGTREEQSREQPVDSV